VPIFAVALYLTMIFYLPQHLARPSARRSPPARVLPSS